MGGRTGRGMARGNAPFLERGCSESAGGVSQKKSRREPYIVRDDLAGDEGFEPPQTESESGVLPLHKSSMWPLRLPRHKQHGYYSTETKNVKHYFPFSATFFLRLQGARIGKKICTEKKKK